MLVIFRPYKRGQDGKIRCRGRAFLCPLCPRRGWAAMIRKVYEVDPLTCSQCGGTMKVIAFITDFSVVDRIIRYLKLTFVAYKPPPPIHSPTGKPVGE